MTETLLTVDEFFGLKDPGVPVELVRGIVQMMNMPNPRHGEVCANVSGLLWSYFRGNPLGRVVGNDSAIVTQRGPDTVRGADVAVYLRDTVAPGPLPQKYLAVVPDIVFEVRSPSDRSSDLLAKTAEYLAAGVKAVCVLDPDDGRLTVYREQQAAKQLAAHETFELPDLLGPFRVRVAEFFG